MNHGLPRYHPPSDALEFKGGLWRPRHISAVSFPEDGNDLCFQIEDDSYWFAHRNECLLMAMRQFPPSGMIYDIGGGNGFVSAALEKAGHETVLVEPGCGAGNALQRGLNRVVAGALEDCRFREDSLPSVGAFDVVEHVEDDRAFLGELHRMLAPGGRFYATVPAFPMLWSDDDVHAGHFRRYTGRSWTHVMEAAGFRVEYVTCLFAWLTLPVGLFRALPCRLRVLPSRPLGTVDRVRSHHRLPWAISGWVRALHRWELSRLGLRKSVPLGTSLLSVARKT